MREFKLEKGHGFADYLLFVDGKAVGVLEAKPAGHTLTASRSRRRSTSRACRRRSQPRSSRCRSSTSPPATRRSSSTSSTPSRARAQSSRSTGRRRSRVAGRRHARRLGQAVRWVLHRRRRHQALVAPRAPAGDAAGRDARPLAEQGAGHRQPGAVPVRRPAARAHPDGDRARARRSWRSPTLYRLIKFGGARRVLFLVDRANLGEQAEKEFQGYRTPDDNRKFTELYNVQRLTSNTIGASSKVVITTIQRLYSMLKGEPDLDPEAEEQLAVRRRPGAARRSRCRSSTTAAIPPEFFDVIFIDECHRSHLLALAAGAGVLRRLPDRPDGDAGQAHLRLLRPEPRDGVRPRAGRGRRRQRGLRGLPDPHADHGAGLHHRGRAGHDGRATATGRRARCAGKPPTRTSPTTAERPRPRRRRQGPDPAHRPHVPRQAAAPRSSPAAPRCRRPSSSPRTTATPRTSSRSSARSSAGGTTSARRSPTRRRARSPPTSSRTSATATTRASPSPWT